ncbi:hypothetical protein N9242_00895 [Vicingaceae bacterium]|nr:hypothetical protein [Vicingaceae bacterium]
MINPSILDLNLNSYNELEELSLQDEILQFILGEDFGVEKFIPFVHRAVKTDKFGDAQHCTCWDKFANEAKIGCPYCEGMGYYWKESIIPAVMFLLNKRKIINVMNTSEAAGREDGYETALITLPEVKIMQNDRVIVPHLNDKGFFQVPYKEDAEYYVKERIEKRLDFGRKEYDFSIISKIQ